MNALADSNGTFRLWRRC